MLLREFAMIRKNLQIIGNVGLYYTCYKLSLMGWNTMPTTRNAKGVDIIAYNSDCSTMLGLQVKTLSKRSAVPLGKSIDNIIGDYWVVVADVEKELTSFILLPEEVRSLTEKREKDGKVSYWLQYKSYNSEQYLEKWNRIK